MEGRITIIGLVIIFIAVNILYAPNYMFMKVEVPDKEITGIVTGIEIFEHIDYGTIFCFYLSGEKKRFWLKRGINAQQIDSLKKEIAAGDSLHIFYYSISSHKHHDVIKVETKSKIIEGTPRETNTQNKLFTYIFFYLLGGFALIIGLIQTFQPLYLWLKTRLNSKNN